MGSRIKDIGNRFRSVIPVVISALGGAMMVFSSYDDSPGGSLIGFSLILVSVYLALKLHQPRV